MKEKVAAYIRVAAAEQKVDDLSRRSQAYKLEAYAAEHDLEIVAFYEDIGVSGRTPVKDRPAMQRMLDDMKAGKFQRILFTRFDRFYRSAPEYCQYLDLPNRVRWTATDEHVSSDTVPGQMAVNALLAEDEAYRRDTANALKDFRKMKAEIIERRSKKNKGGDEMNIKELREQTGMTQKEFAQYFGFSIRTVGSWEDGSRNCPKYLFDLIAYKLKNEGIVRG